MSLTSYRAAPPRVRVFGLPFAVGRVGLWLGLPVCSSVLALCLCVFGVVERGCSVIGRPGSDLLSQVLRHSTIGAEEFNGRVRDGIGFGLLARATRPANDRFFCKTPAQSLCDCARKE